MRGYIFYLLGVAAAAPTEDLVIRAASTSPVVCSVVNSLVTKLKVQPQATSYCSSFLKIPTATTTVTKTNIPYVH